MKTIHMISGPRNISTAMMYSFAQRPDTRVFDEPFYAVYLLSSNAQHPGRQEVIDSQPNTEEKVWQQLAAQDAPILFIKNMAHHIEVLEKKLPDDAVHIFLIRDPAHILQSYSKVIERPAMRDIGIAYQYHLFKHLISLGMAPVVVDSGLMLEDPPRVLRELCDRCGISFDQRMLHWTAGPKKYDGVWAPHWYANVHASTGFASAPRKEHKVPAACEILFEEALIFYEKMLPFSLKA